MNISLISIKNSTLEKGSYKTIEYLSQEHYKSYPNSVNAQKYYNNSNCTSDNTNNHTKNTNNIKRSNNNKKENKKNSDKIQIKINNNIKMIRKDIPTM